MRHLATDVHYSQDVAAIIALSLFRPTPRNGSIQSYADAVPGYTCTHVMHWSIINDHPISEILNPQLAWYNILARDLNLRRCLG